MLFVLYGALLALVYYIVQYYRWVARYPKGPIPLPMVGNMLQLDSHKLHEQLPELRKKYGNVFTIFLPVPLVVLMDYESVKEAFIRKGDDFIGRPSASTLSECRFGENQGVIFSEGDSWRENRRVALTIMRNFGMGKNLMEEQVKLSVMEYLRCLENIKDKSAVDMRWPVQIMVANIINETLFGFRYKHEDAAPLIDYVETLNIALANLASFANRFASISFPWIKKIPIVRYYLVEKYRPQLNKLSGYVVTHSERALKDYTPDMEPECFVQAYKQAVGKNAHITDSQLLDNCTDFFIAGQETTSTTLRWTMLFMANNKEAQRKLRAEIREVCGTNMVTMADKLRMPFATACVLESQRCANIIQTNVIHRTVVDTEVLGHKIPANTLVNGDIHQILSTDPIFTNTQEFRPERYLNADGKTLNKELVDHTVPFSIGKRQCAGEALARVELFLGLCATFQHYELVPNGKIDLRPTDESSVILMPRTTYLQLIPVAE